MCGEGCRQPLGSESSSWLKGNKEAGTPVLQLQRPEFSHSLNELGNDFIPGASRMEHSPDSTLISAT